MGKPMVQTSVRTGRTVAETTRSEITVSLPAMGPNFNFYKFKGLSEMYKTQLR